MPHWARNNGKLVAIVYTNTAPIYGTFEPSENVPFNVEYATTANVPFNASNCCRLLAKLRIPVTRAPGSHKSNENEISCDSNVRLIRFRFEWYRHTCIEFSTLLNLAAGQNNK